MTEFLQGHVSSSANELPAALPFAPILDKVLNLVSKYIPGVADEIEAKVAAESNLTCGSFRLEGIRNAADLLGRHPTFSISKIDGIRFAHTSKDNNPAQMVIRMARSLISSQGVATVADIAEQVAHEVLVCR